MVIPPCSVCLLRLSKMVCRHTSVPGRSFQRNKLSLHIRRMIRTYTAAPWTFFVQVLYLTERIDGNRGGLRFAHYILSFGDVQGRTLRPVGTRHGPRGCSCVVAGFGANFIRMCCVFIRLDSCSSPLPRVSLLNLSYPCLAALVQHPHPHPHPLK